jgi:hypothetical protein
MALGVLGVPFVVGSLEKIAGLSLPMTGAGPWAWIGFLGAVSVASLYPIWRMNRTDAVRSVRTG